MASKRNGTLYIGSTGNLVKRIWQHKHKSAKGFTARYDVNMLVYYEILDDALNAYTRERLMKKWKRVWKISLIEVNNPDWKDLYDEIK